MTTHSRETSGRTDPVMEALMKELLGTASHPKASRGEDALTAALLEASLASLTSRGEEQAPMETAMLAAALAPALADALAPVLAEALTPALVKALNEIIEKRTGQEAPPPRKGSKREED